MKDFELGGVEVPLEAGHTFSQEYQSKRRSTTYLMGDGSSTRQTLAGTADKLVTTIKGSGWSPLGIAGLDYTSSMTLKCAEPRSVTETDVSIDIPSARRTDTGYDPVGFAIVSGELVSTSIGIAGNTATLGAVSGATAYIVQYHPQITVLATFTEGMDANASSYSWEIIAEEI